VKEVSLGGSDSIGQSSVSLRKQWHNINVGAGCLIARCGEDMLCPTPPRFVVSYPPWVRWLALVAIMSVSLGLLAEVNPVRSRTGTAGALEAREQRIWRLPVHASQFADVPHTTARSRCEKTEAPEALTTPNPVLDDVDSDTKIQVSFIVGTDGRVHSPLILQSGGSGDLRAVLDTVRSWRYRPAMCNGVPTETEGKIQFSSR
jgi:Gram-negative bacterial TonB protein C-terminal